MALSIGDAAPDFNLYDSAKDKVSLSTLKGHNVLLLFFPQAFTRVCTKELCAIRDDIARYNNADARVFGISVDSVFTLAEYKQSQNYNFPLLSDFNKEASRAFDTVYDSWILDMKGVSKRSAFIIDKKGIIRYAEVLDNAGDEPNYEAINKTLQDLS